MKTFRIKVRVDNTGYRSVSTAASACREEGGDAGRQLPRSGGVTKERAAASSSPHTLLQKEVKHIRGASKSKNGIDYFRVVRK